MNAGIRRAAAPIVVVMDPSVEVTGDLVGPLVTALEDPTVAVAGLFGIVSDDLRHFEEPAEGVVDVDAIEGYAMAFRRADYGARGPLDEHFAFYRNLDIWWSLVLRDGDWDEEDRDGADPPGGAHGDRPCSAARASRLDGDAGGRAGPPLEEEFTDPQTVRDTPGPAGRER